MNIRTILILIPLKMLVASQATAAVIYTNDFSSEFDANSRDAHILGGASPTIGFEDFFGPLDNNGVGIDPTAGELNFIANVNARGAGVWLDSSSWAAGTTVEVKFDISDFTAGTGSPQTYFQALEATGVDASNSVGVDIHNGGGIETSATGTASIAAIGAQGDINGAGAYCFTFVHDGADATAFVVHNRGVNSPTFTLDNLTVSIPEPTSGLLLTLSGLGFILRRRR